MNEQIQKFQSILNKAKNIVCLTGAGISAESGIPVFRGDSGEYLWRKYNATEVATPQAFKRNPSLVWEFYHYRRTIAFEAKPNAAHYALTKYEQLCNGQNGRCFNIITQNVDGLHQRSGSVNVLELHGSLREIRCTKCGYIETNTENPLCEALRNRGDPNQQDPITQIPIEQLPQCSKCKSLTRPHIVWFGEHLNANVMSQAQELINKCDLCLVIGTSSVVYPAAMFAPSVAARGVPVAEFNITQQPASEQFQLHFAGPCGTTIPNTFGIELI